MEDRRLAAIVFTDIVGYSSLMANDENTALAIVQQQREILLPMINKHGGQWLKEMGDGTLSSYDSASRAVLCAIEIQGQLKALNHFAVRIGIHLGDVVFTGQDVFGDGVNIAARIESIAEPGGIAITGQVFDTLSSNKSIETIYLGEKQLKNIDRPVRVYGVCNNNLPVGAAWSKETNPSPTQKKNLVLLTLQEKPWASLLIAATAAAIIGFNLITEPQAILEQPSSAKPLSSLNEPSVNQQQPPAPILDLEQASVPDSSSEPGASDSTPISLPNSNITADPEAIFVTPIVESVPAFNTQATGSTATIPDQTPTKPRTVDAAQQGIKEIEKPEI